jgi:hypothetical protein
VRLLFLLKDSQGKGLLIAQAGSKAEAEAFGRSHVPEFCGECMEIDMERRAEAEDFWGVRTVRVAQVLSDSQKPVARPRTRPPALPVTFTQFWVRGPQLPQDVVEADLLTPEDHRDLTLDHIARTSEVVGHLEICKWGSFGKQS